MRTELVISFTIDGYHSWPTAPDEFSEFRNIHRHLFKIVCNKMMPESDVPDRRQTELWALRSDTIAHINYLFGNPANFKNMSCEGIADYIIGLGFCKVSVCEEENMGAIVYD